MTKATGYIGEDEVTIKYEYSPAVVERRFRRNEHPGSPESYGIFEVILKGNDIWPYVPEYLPEEEERLISVCRNDWLGLPDLNWR